MSICGEVSLLHPFRILSWRRESFCSYNVAVQKCLQIKCFRLLFMQGLGGGTAHLKKQRTKSFQTSRSSKRRTATSTLNNLVQSHLVSQISVCKVYIKQNNWSQFDTILSKKGVSVGKLQVCFQLVAWHTASHLTSVFLLCVLVEQSPSVSCLLCCPSLQFCAFLDKDFHYSSTEACCQGVRHSKYFSPVQHTANGSEEKQSIIYTAVSACAMALY